MRKDLNKLLCEEERYGSSRSFKEVRRKKVFQADEEFQAGRESMKKRHVVSGNEKMFGEHLSPLYGIVRKNVGRKWDDVYSELAEVFDFRSVINDHILQHLWGYVERYAYVDDGVIMVRGRYSRGAEQLELSSTEFYIHPTTGVLCKNEQYKTYDQQRREREAEREAEKRKTCVPFGKNQELRRRDENSPWFVCTIAYLPWPKGKQEFVQYGFGNYGGRKHGYWRTTYPDVVTLDWWTKKTVERYGITYCSGFRSASKKDLKAAGLKD
mgnify:CR=1 FL=1